MYNTFTKVLSLMNPILVVAKLRRVRNWGWFLIQSTFFTELVFCFWNCQSILSAHPTCFSESRDLFFSIRPNICSSSVQLFIWLINGSKVKGRKWNTLQEKGRTALRQSILKTMNLGGKKTIFSFTSQIFLGKENHLQLVVRCNMLV